VSHGFITKYLPAAYTAIPIAKTVNAAITILSSRLWNYLGLQISKDIDLILDFECWMSAETPTQQTFKATEKWFLPQQKEQPQAQSKTLLLLWASS
jgi:hypothetical protein